MTDFYRDASFEADEITALLEELTSVENPTQLEVWEQLVDLCKIAQDQDRGLEAIAD